MVSLQDKTTVGNGAGEVAMKDLHSHMEEHGHIIAKVTYSCPTYPSF